MNDARAKAILDYWLAHEPRWWSGDDAMDREIREQFAPDLERARKGELDQWTAHPSTLVALVILLDQFSRHVHRGSKEAYACDAKAQATVLVSIARGLDRQLPPLHRAIFYLPLVHAEDPAIQERAVELYAELAEADPKFESFREHAVRHCEIVDRFGRFPHRNELLGRASTPEELAFLAEPGPRY